MAVLAVLGVLAGRFFRQADFTVQKDDAAYADKLRVSHEAAGALEARGLQRLPKRRCAQEQFLEYGPRLASKTSGVKALRGAAGYIVVHGRDVGHGLREQREQLVNAAVLARLLNLQLVLPSTWWQPGIVYQMEHFRKMMDTPFGVNVLFDLPAEIREGLHSGKSRETNVEVPEGVGEAWHLEHVVPLLQTYNVLHVHSLVRRVVGVARPLRYLRCWADFHALRFRDEIEAMAKQALQRLKGGGYVAVNLPDEAAAAAAVTRADVTQAAADGGDSGGGDEAEAAAERQRLDARRRRIGAADVMDLLLELGVQNETQVFIAGGISGGGEEEELLGARAAEAGWQVPVRARDLVDLGALARDHALPGALPVAAVNYLIGLYSHVLVNVPDAKNVPGVGSAMRAHRAYLNRFSFDVNTALLRRLKAKDILAGSDEYSEHAEAAHAGGAARIREDKLLRLVEAARPDCLCTPSDEVVAAEIALAESLLAEVSQNGGTEGAAVAAGATASVVLGKGRHAPTRDALEEVTVSDSATYTHFYFEKMAVSDLGSSPAAILELWARAPQFLEEVEDNQADKKRKGPASI